MSSITTHAGSKIRGKVDFYRIEMAKALESGKLVITSILDLGVY